MPDFKAAFSGFSVDDLAKAKQFYMEVLGLEIVNENMGLEVGLPQGARVFIYEKDDHQPASYTTLNFVVDDINGAVDELVGKSVNFDRYDMGENIQQDERGILRGIANNMGPDIAWFKDPAGNILAVLQES